MRQELNFRFPPGFDSRSIHVRSEADKVALGQIFFRVLRFSLSLRTSFHQCSRFIFTNAILLQEVQTDETWEPSKKQHFFGNGENWLEKNLTLFYASKLDQGSLWISSILEQMLILYQNVPLY